MKNISEILTILMTCILCVYSFFSAVNINSGIVCAICFVFSAIIIIVNFGKIKIRSIYLKWGINITCIFTYLFVSQQGGHAFNILLLALIVMGIAVTTASRKIDVEKLVRVIVGFSICSLFVVLLEMIFRSRFLNLLSFILPRSSLEAELLRINSGSGFRGLAEYPNVLSIAAAVVLFYSLWFIDEKHKVKKYVLLVLATIGIVITGERSNIVLIPVAGVFVYYFDGGKEKAVRFFKILAAVLLFVIIFFAMRSYLSQFRLFSRVYNLIDLYVAGEDILGGRQNLNSTALSLWLQKPIFGNGWFYFFYNNMGILHGGSYSHAHNFIFEILCDSGIVGLILALIPIISFLIENIQIIKRNTQSDIKIFKFTLAIQMLFVMDSMFHVTFYSLNMIGLYFLVIMLMYTKRSQKLDSL